MSTFWRYYSHRPGQSAQNLKAHAVVHIYHVNDYHISTTNTFLDSAIVKQVLTSSESRYPWPLAKLLRNCLQLLLVAKHSFTSECLHIVLWQVLNLALKSRVLINRLTMYDSVLLSRPVSGKNGAMGNPGSLVAGQLGWWRGRRLHAPPLGPCATRA